MGYAAEDGAVEGVSARGRQVGKGVRRGFGTLYEKAGEAM